MTRNPPPVLLLCCFALLPFVAQCSAVQTVPEPRDAGGGFIAFDVKPPSAEVAIDERYSGRIDHWVRHTVPVAAGTRRVTVMAKGFITQRFDVDVEPGEIVTLQLKMEPTLEEEQPDNAHRRHARRRRH